MKLAIFSDVHANLPALEAVLADIDGRGDLEAVYHLGDLVGYAPWPNETAELVRGREIPGIAGNYDSTVADRLRALRLQGGDAARGGTLPPELRMDPRARFAGDKELSGPATFPPGPSAARGTQVQTATHPRPRYTDPQHPLLDGGSSRLVLQEDGGFRRGQERRHPRLRPHPQALAPGGGRRPPSSTPAPLASRRTATGEQGT